MLKVRGPDPDIEYPSQTRATSGSSYSSVAAHPGWAQAHALSGSTGSGAVVSAPLRAGLRASMILRPSFLCKEYRAHLPSGRCHRSPAGGDHLFPVSILGHSVLVPAWLGGSWADLVTRGDAANSEGSHYLSFIVASHVATAIALLVFYAKDWVRIIGVFITSVRTRRIETSSQRLTWLIGAATVPVGITGLKLEHPLRTLFAKPLAAIFLTLNGLILAGGEILRRRAVAATGEGHTGGVAIGTHCSLETLEYKEAGVIGLFQTLAGPGGDGILGQVLVGAVVAAYASVQFLTRYFARCQPLPGRLSVRGSRTLPWVRVHHEAPDGLGVHRIKLKEAEPNA